MVLLESALYAIRGPSTGKSFYAFWRLLTDVEQSTIFSEALTEVVSRQFARELMGYRIKNISQNLPRERMTLSRQERSGNAHTGILAAAASTPSLRNQPQPDSTEQPRSKEIVK